MSTNQTAFVRCKQCGELCHRRNAYYVSAETGRIHGEPQCRQCYEEQVRKHARIWAEESSRNGNGRRRDAGDSGDDDLDFPAELQDWDGADWERLFFDRSQYQDDIGE